MLAAIYYGAMYGGSTTAILVNIPGEVASVVTTLDGYQMARQGRAGPALTIAAISSFVAGTLGLIGLTFFAPPLADVALRIGPPEYFGLVVLAFSVVVSLSGPSLVQGPERGGGRRPGGAGGPRSRCRATRRFAYGSTTTARRYRLHRRDHRSVRHHRGAGGRGGEDGRSLAGAPRQADAARGTSCGRASGRCCARPASASCSVCCRAARPARSRSSRTTSRSACRRRRSGSGTAPSRAWRRRRAPTMPPPAPASCRSSHWACRPRPRWPCC